jgi:hypothetical protein
MRHQRSAKLRPLSKHHADERSEDASPDGEHQEGNENRHATYFA